MILFKELNEDHNQNWIQTFCMKLFSNDLPYDGIEGDDLHTFTLPEISL